MHPRRRYSRGSPLLDRDHVPGAFHLRCHWPEQGFDPRRQTVTTDSETVFSRQKWHSIRSLMSKTL